MRNRLIALFVLLISIVAVSSAMSDTAAQTKPISNQEINATLQVISDEIYANDLQGYEADVGASFNPSTDSFTYYVYIDPKVTQSGRSQIGRAIYKLLPYGQVYRLFKIDKNGVVTLVGRLKSEFRMSELSHLTVYMANDELCKQLHTWPKYGIQLTSSPSVAMLKEVRKREKRRYGDSRK